MNVYQRSALACLIALSGFTVVSQASIETSYAHLETPRTQAPPSYQVTSHNAALLYYRAWLDMSSDLSDTLADDGETLSLPVGASEILEANAHSIENLLRATRQHNADWDVEYEMGFDALMPHLGKMRYSIKIFAADALRCIEQGDSDGAAERIAAMYCAAGHLKNDHILISTLVGLSMTNLSNRLTEQLLDDQSLTPANAEIILVAMRKIDLSNPIGVRDAIRGECDITVNYFTKNFSGPDAGAKLIEALQSWPQDQAESTRAISKMDGEELREDLSGASRYYQDVLALWDEPDAATQIAALVTPLENEEYGIFTKFFGAAFGRARQNVEAFVISQTKTMARLQTVAQE